MKFLRLDFSQKIWLGFAIIILLLSLSSVLSLFNLADISDSTTQVNENAVPVLKQSNLVQISLLKQAKISSSGFNATNEREISEAIQEFKQIAVAFDQQYAGLAEIVVSDPIMTGYVTEARVHYDAYKVAVNEMFAAKREVLAARAKAEIELRELSNLVDDAGAYLLDVVWTEYGEDDVAREKMEGIQGRIDGQIIGLFNVVDEINRSEDLQYLDEAKNSIEDAISGILVRSNHAEVELPDLKGREIWQSYLATLEDFKVKSGKENSLTDLKIRQIKQADLAIEQLKVSDASIKLVVNEFDQLLLAADNLFNTEQAGVFETVDFGSKSTLIAWIILLLMASQNFNSMRKSIKKKMADLAKLNSTGEVLASLMDKNKALEEVLAAMQVQVGVAQGSVYLMNEEERLEVKAFYPPKQIDQASKPTQFKVGEGIIGQAAQEKKIIYVPNTAKDDHFVKQKETSSKALLCVPLVDKDVLIGVMNFSGTVKDVTFEDSDYEFASSIARLLVTTIKNIRMLETIEEQNRTLEQKVKERTEELRQKNKDVAVMMANLNQGLFTIMEGGVIHQEYSAYLEEILETKQIANRNFMDLIFSDTNLGVDQTQQLSTALDSLIGVDEMMYDFNSHLLVNEVVLNLKQDRKKIIELDWVPIVNQDTDEIEKMMVTIRDVTELRALQIEAEAQKKELEMIGQILAISADKFLDFISSAYQFINECRDLIQRTEAKDDAVVALVFRNMHTIKGNARTYGFKYVTDSVHQAEHTYDEYRKDPDKEWDQAHMLTELAAAESDIRHYENLAKEKLGSIMADSDGSVSIDVEKMQSLIEQAITLDYKAIISPAREWFKDAYSALATTLAQPVSKVIEPVLESVNSLAQELGKEPPTVNVDDGGVLVTKEANSLLNSVFMHVFRNAMDHGIESSEARQKQGKSAKGVIDFTVKTEKDKIIFTIQDDGKGMAIDHIFAKAVELGIYQEGQSKPPTTEIANLVFHSGFSTAKEVTEVSGRGVGMEAVKQFLEESGGSIEIQLDQSQQDKSFVPFVTKISISDRFCIKPIDSKAVN